MRSGWKEIVTAFEGYARLLWDVRVPNGHLRAYSLSGEVFIVHDYGDGDGWQVYGKVTADGRVDATIQAIADAAHLPISPDWVSPEKREQVKV